MTKSSKPRVRVTPPDPRPGSYEWTVAKCEKDSDERQRTEQARQARMREVLTLVPGARTFGHIWTVPCPSPSCSTITRVEFRCEVEPITDIVCGHGLCGVTKYVRKLLHAAWIGDDLTMKDLVAGLRASVNSDEGEI